MPIKNSELHSSVWKSCDEQRGGMDASQYKDYVLVLLFVKDVSDKASTQKHYDLEVPEGGHFGDIVALKGSKDIGDKMNKVIAKAIGRLLGVTTTKSCRTSEMPIVIHSIVESKPRRTLRG